MADPYDDRRKARILRLVGAVMQIRQQKGGATMDEIQIAQAATISEMKGLWQALIDKKLITEAQRQDYLDRGVQELCAQFDAQASQIYIQDGGHG